MIRKRESTTGTRYQVWVYRPLTGKKEPCGTYGSQREARKVERDTEEAFAAEARKGRRLPTITEAIAWWLTEHPRPEATSNRHNEQAIRGLERAFGPRRLDDLDPSEARTWALTHRGPAKAASALYNDAHRFLPGFDGANPFARLRLPEQRGRTDDEPLTTAEVMRLADMAPILWPGYGVVMRAWIIFAAWVGCRPGETNGLSWERVDFKAHTVDVRRQARFDGPALPKTKRTRTIVLPPAAAEALRTVPRQERAKIEGEPLIFTSPTGKALNKGSHNYYWRQLRARVGMDDLDAYDLRHHAASMLANNGATIEELAFQLGNSPEVCRRYVHIYEESMRDRLRAAYGANVAQLREASERAS